MLGKNHINGIENVFASIMLANVSKSGYAKHRLSKFKGIKKENFLLHLKETEFRYKASSSIEMSKYKSKICIKSC